VPELFAGGTEVSGGQAPRHLVLDPAFSPVSIRGRHTPMLRVTLEAIVFLINAATWRGHKLSIGFARAQSLATTAGTVKIWIFC